VLKKILLSRLSDSWRTICGILIGDSSAECVCMTGLHLFVSSGSMLQRISIGTGGTAIQLI